MCAQSKFKFEKQNFSLSAQDQQLMASCLGGRQTISEVTRVQGAVQREDGTSFKGEKDEKIGDKPRSMFKLKNEEGVGRIHYFCALPDNDGSIEALMAKVTLHKTSSRRQHTRFSCLPIFDKTKGKVRFVSWTDIGQRVAFASHSVLDDANMRVALTAPP